MAPPHKALLLAGVHLDLSTSSLTTSAHAISHAIPSNEHTPTHPQGEGSLPPPLCSWTSHSRELSLSLSLSLSDAIEQVWITHLGTNLYKISTMMSPYISVLCL